MTFALFLAAFAGAIIVWLVSLEDETDELD